MTDQDNHIVHVQVQTGQDTHAQPEIWCFWSRGSLVCILDLGTLSLASAWLHTEHFFKGMGDGPSLLEVSCLACLLLCAQMSEIQPLEIFLFVN